MWNCELDDLRTEIGLLACFRAIRTFPRLGGLFGFRRALDIEFNSALVLVADLGVGFVRELLGG